MGVIPHRSAQIINKIITLQNLFGGFNPFEKYARQIGSFPAKIGVKIPKNA